MQEIDDMKKENLGGNVYAEWTGDAILLTTVSGEPNDANRVVTGSIKLDRDTFIKFERWLRDVKGDLACVD